MRIKYNFNQRYSSVSWQFLVTTLLVLGIFFRFYNLELKIYWFDETYTLLRASGYTETEVVQQTFNGSLITAEDLLQYQQVNTDKSITDTITSIAKEEPQHTPFYYLLVKFWGQLFGNSVTAVRSLSAVFSLFAFPCIYWLCWELFSSPMVASTAVALLAISPFHVLYAQEARPYSLWTATILLSSAALLRAIRLNHSRAWLTYALSLTLGLYSFLFTVLVAIGHGTYVVLREKLRVTSVVIAYLWATAIALLLVSPWFVIVAQNFVRVQQTTRQLTETETLSYFIKAWLGRTSYVFVDVNPFSADSSFKVTLITQYLLGIIVLSVLAYACYFLVRNTAPKTWLFVVTLITTTLLGLLLPDLLWGGTRSVVNRYLIPCFLGFQLILAYLITQKIKFYFRLTWTEKFWHFLIAFIFSCGVISCVISSQAEMWWNKGANYYIPFVADIINQSEHPLVISDDRSDRKPLINVLGDVMSLGHQLNPQVQLQLVIEPNIPSIPSSEFSDIFLFKASPTLRAGLKQQGYHLKLIYENPEWINTNLYKLDNLIQ
jgi:uncharacterized membrane protein